LCFDINTLKKKDYFFMARNLLHTLSLVEQVCQFGLGGVTGRHLKACTLFPRKLAQEGVSRQKTIMEISPELTRALKGAAEMKKSIKSTLMGVATALAMTGAHAADISLTPESNEVLVGGSFTLTIEGTGFENDVRGGNVTVMWDDTQVALTSTATDISQSAAANGFGFAFPGIQISPASVTVGFVTNFLSGELSVEGPDFSFLDLTFTALAVGSGQATIAAASGGGWLNGTGSAQEIANYSPANITVNEVPLPAAVWLFGTGLLGLAGIARRRNQAEAATA
jgi:hypothetical protein